MAKPTQSSCCGGVFSYTLITIVLLCLLFQPSTALPKITLEDFTVLALKETTNSSRDLNTINFDLKLRNLDTDPIYYDALNLTFYYKSNLSNFPVGNTTFTPFYQRKLHSDHRVGNFEAKGVNWENVTATTTFRVELATAVRYQIKTYWKTKRLRFVIGADLNVNGEGNLVNKGVELTSKGGRNIKGSLEMVAFCFCFILGSFMI